MPETVSVPAHAKVNLLLRVLAREHDGFHGIETLLCRLALADSIAAERRGQPGEVTIDVRGMDVGPPEDNLAVRAARMVLEGTGRRFGVHLLLDKRIPVQAGLGGGSADAAAALAAVNQLAGNAVPASELLHFAARLGSDVPFALAGGALALAWAHGNRMLRLPALPSAPVLLLIPPRPIATPEAYRWVDEARQGSAPRGGLALELDALTSWGDVARMAGNDFESPVFGREPAIRSAFEALVGTRPILCRMSGSGSSLFAVYRSERDRDDARMALGRRHGATIVTATT